MTVSIRLQGLPNEVDRLLNILEQCPEIDIDRKSKEYLDRNTSSVRRYIDVELREIDRRMFDEYGVLINGHARMATLKQLGIEYRKEEDHNA